MEEESGSGVVTCTDVSLAVWMSKQMLLAGGPASVQLHG